MEVVIQFKEATENSLDVLNDPQSSWKYVENMYNMNIQSSSPFLNLFFLIFMHANEGPSTSILAIECMQVNSVYSYLV